MEKMPEPLEWLLEEAHVKAIPKNQIIFYVGESPQEIYFIKSGVVKVYSIDEDGNEKILHLISKDGILPLAIFSGKKIVTQWFYTALTDCELYRLPLAAVNKLMDQDAETTLYLMHWFSLETHELLVRLESMGRTNVHDKLVAALKFLAVCHSHDHNGWNRVNFPVSHQLLADLTGITRESAATAMKEMTDAGVVRNPRLTVLEINFKKLILL